MLAAGILAPRDRKLQMVINDVTTLAGIPELPAGYQITDWMRWHSPESSVRVWPSVPLIHIPLHMIASCDGSCILCVYKPMSTICVVHQSLYVKCMWCDWCTSLRDTHHCLCDRVSHRVHPHLDTAAGGLSFGARRTMPTVRRPSSRVLAWSVPLRRAASQCGCILVP